MSGLTRWHLKLMAEGPRSRVQELCSRPGGATQAEALAIIQSDCRAIARMFYRMLLAHQIHKEVGRKYEARFFSTPEAAATYVRGPEERTPDCPGCGRLQKDRVKKPKPIPKSARVLKVVSPHWKEKRYQMPVEAVVTAQTIVTICPSSPTYSRHQVAPGDPIPSVISARECSSWARTVWGAV
jgi:hypothetical protein